MTKTTTKKQPHKRTLTKAAEKLVTELSDKIMLNTLLAMETLAKVDGDVLKEVMLGGLITSDVIDEVVGNVLKQDARLFDYRNKLSEPVYTMLTNAAMVTHNIKKASELAAAFSKSTKRKTSLAAAKKRFGEEVIEYLVYEYEYAFHRDKKSFKKEFGTENPEQAVKQLELFVIKVGSEYTLASFEPSDKSVVLVWYDGDWEFVRLNDPKQKKTTRIRRSPQR